MLPMTQGVATGLVAQCPYRAFPMRSIATKGLIPLLSLEFRALPWAIGSMPFQGVSDALNSNQRADSSFVFGIQGVTLGYRLNALSGRFRCAQ